MGLYKATDHFGTYFFHDKSRLERDDFPSTTSVETTELRLDRAICQIPSRENLLEQARACVNADPARRWTVGLMARELGMSSRSLQRRLKREGSGFSQVLGGVRLAHSAELLTETTCSPAEIGYASGYSDQAHFTRAFKQLTALTPALFRENFT